MPSLLDVEVKRTKISKTLQATRGGPSDGAGTVWSQFGTVDTQSWLYFMFLMNKSRAYAVRSQSWSFETDYTQSCIFMPCFDTNSHLKAKPSNFTSIVNAIWKAMTKNIFLAPSLGGGQGYLFTVGGFFNKREYFGADWIDLLIYRFVCYLDYLAMVTSIF